MGLDGWIIYVILGIIGYFGLGYIDKKFEINKIDKIVFSIIYMILVSGFCFKYSLRYTDNIFLIFVFMMIVDVIYNTYVIDGDFFDKNEKNISYYITLIIVSFIVNQFFINEVSEIFLTGSELRVVLWLLIIIFIYSFSKDKGITMNVHTEKMKYMSTNSVLTHYAKFKYLYYDDCDCENRDISNVLYAIMIYENHNRSKILRNYDNFMYKINGKNSKLGIMQVDTRKYISDSESIKIVYDKLSKLYNKKKNKDINNLIDDYYGFDNQYVKYIFDIIRKF